MFPAYVDPIAHGLGPLFGNLLRVEFGWVAALGLLGVLTVPALLGAEMVRSRRRGASPGERRKPRREAAEAA